MAQANAHGQLGLGDAKSRARPEKVLELPGGEEARVSCLSASGHVVACVASGALYSWGKSFSSCHAAVASPRRLDAEVLFVATNVGESFAVAIDLSGALWSGPHKGHRRPV